MENPRFRKVPADGDVPEYDWLILDEGTKTAAPPQVPDTSAVVAPPFAWVWNEFLNDDE